MKMREHLSFEMVLHGSPGLGTHEIRGSRRSYGWNVLGQSRAFLGESNVHQGTIPETPSGKPIKYHARKSL